MSIQRRHWPRVAEFWFGEPFEASGADVAYLYQAPAIPKGVVSNEKHTLVVDLQQTPEALLAGMKQETRYEVRRALQKDGLTEVQAHVPSVAEVDAFQAFYAEFAAEKGLVSVSRSYLLAALEAGGLQLSASCAGEEVLVRHSYLVVGKRARLWHSASLFRGQDGARRNLIGRANRLLHYQDMLAFKVKGIQEYDFGGWYAGAEDEEKLRINKFKEGFGGVPRCEYEATLPLTLVGRLYLAARGFRGI